MSTRAHSAVQRVRLPKGGRPRLVLEFATPTELKRFLRRLAREGEPEKLDAWFSRLSKEMREALERLEDEYDVKEIEKAKRRGGKSIPIEDFLRKHPPCV